MRKTTRIFPLLAWRHWPWAALLGLLFATGACESERVDAIGGETHFLRLCDDDPSACGSDFECLCGVCTVSCESQGPCASLYGSECTAQDEASCTGSPAQQTCQVSCSGDDDCLVLSAQHQCQNGNCRLGVAPPIGTDCEPSGVLANEVLFIGDSFFATTHQITGFVEELARSQDVLAAGERYRDSSRLMQNALAWGGEGILDQYQSAAADVSVRVVIMNGGGADVLLGSCDDVSPDCPMITDAVAAFEDVLARMAQDQVTDVVYVSYPDPQPEDVRALLDVLRPLLQDVCDNSPVPCQFLDLRPVFEDNYSSFVQAGGLNPTTEGARATAQAIWAVMEDGCIAQ